MAKIARFDDRGLWSHEGVWFSHYGTLLATVEAFVNRFPQGYYAPELANELHAEVQEPLRHLVQQQRLSRLEVDGQFLIYRHRFSPAPQSDPGPSQRPGSSLGGPLRSASVLSRRTQRLTIRDAEITAMPIA